MRFLRLSIIFTWLYLSAWKSLSLSVFYLLDNLLAATSLELQCNYYFFVFPVLLNDVIPLARTSVSFVFIINFNHEVLFDLFLAVHLWSCYLRLWAKYVRHHD